MEREKFRSDLRRNLVHWCTAREANEFTNGGNEDTASDVFNLNHQDNPGEREKMYRRGASLAMSPTRSEPHCSMNCPCAKMIDR